MESEVWRDGVGRRFRRHPPHRPRREATGDGEQDRHASGDPDRRRRVCRRGGYFLWPSRWRGWPMASCARADAAGEGRGNTPRPSELYTEHLAVVPDDIEVKLKYAEAMPQESEVAEAAGGSAGDLRGRPRTSTPAATDVRRRAAELATEMGGMFERARVHLEILLKTAGRDGHLEYLMARCREQEGDFARAAEYYGSADRARGPGADRGRRGGWRRCSATSWGEKDEADRVIDAMVKSDPDDYRVYLGRGHTARLSERQGERRRLPQGAGTGPRPARGLPGGRRARRSASRGPTRRGRSWTRAWRRRRGRSRCIRRSPTSSRGPATSTRRSTRWSWA